MVIPVSVFVEIVMPWLIVVVVAVPHIFARMIVVVARVVPRMAATPIPAIVNLAMTAVVPMGATVPIRVTIVPAIIATMRIANVDMHGAGTEMDALGFRFVRLDG